MSEILKAALSKAATGRSLWSIATAAELRPETLYRFRDGRQNLSLESAEKLARVLGLELTQK